MVSPGTNADDAAEVLEKIRDIKFAMVTTLDDDGEMRVRPLTLQEAEGDATLWFFVERSSDVAAEILRDARTLASFAHVGDNWYVALAGRGYIVHDPQKVEALWSTLAAAWFPGGPHDPSLALLRIDVDTVEYWKPGPGGKLMQFASMAKAALTRTPPANVGEHGSFAT